MPDRLSLAGLDGAGASYGDVPFFDGVHYVPQPMSGVGAGGHREVLMASGVTSPPEPLESSDGTDWLYGEAD